MLKLRMMYLHVLKPGGKTEWIHVPWGKKSLDEIRKTGAYVIGYWE